MFDLFLVGRFLESKSLGRWFGQQFCELLDVLDYMVRLLRERIENFPRTSDEHFGDTFLQWLELEQRLCGSFLGYGILPVLPSLSCEVRMMRIFISFDEFA